MKKLLLLITPILFAISCKTIQKVPLPNYSGRPLKKENAYRLLAKLKTRNCGFQWLSAHFSMDMEVDSSGTSFGGVIRMCKDSLIWMSISPLLGIEVARIMLTLDTAMFMDRIHDTYFKGNYNYIDSLLDNDADFEEMQSVMIGAPVDFYYDSAKLKGYNDGTEYILSTIRRRRIKRTVFRNKPIRSKDDAQIIWFDTKDYHINRIRIADFVNHRTFDAYYDNFQIVDSTLFPFHIRYVITAGKIIQIDLKYKKVNFKLKEETPFYIPAKYARIKY